MILSTDQGAYDTQHETMGMLGLPAEKVKVRNCLVGGGFGGKIDLVTEPVTALLAIKTGRPVKMVYNRTEEFCCTRTRHAAKVDLTMAVKKDGTITQPMRP